MENKLNLWSYNVARRNKPTGVKMHTVKRDCIPSMVLRVKPWLPLMVPEETLGIQPGIARRRAGVMGSTPIWHPKVQRTHAVQGDPGRGYQYTSRNMRVDGGRELRCKLLPVLFKCCKVYVASEMKILP